MTIGVSSYSTGTVLMDAEFGVSAEVGTVGLTTFILGFAFGSVYPSIYYSTYAGWYESRC